MILATYYTPSFEALAELTVPVMREYAQTWDYSFQAERIATSDNAIWHKLDYILQFESANSGAIWMDVDCLITNLRFDFSTNRPLRMAMDKHGPCACILSVGDKRGWRILRAVRELGDVTGGDKQDQSTLRHLMDHFPRVNDSVDPNIMVSDPGGKVEGSPVYHAWSSGAGLAQAVYEVQQRLR